MFMLTHINIYKRLSLGVAICLVTRILNTHTDFIQIFTDFAHKNIVYILSLSSSLKCFLKIFAPCISKTKNIEKSLNNQMHIWLFNIVLKKLSPPTFFTHISITRCVLIKLLIKHHVSYETFFSKTVFFLVSFQ